eukprot:COSAG02_NODE_57641_length_280_cov_0.569061_1_plen_43_part_10
MRVVATQPLQLFREMSSDRWWRGKHLNLLLGQESTIEIQVQPH